MERWNVGTLERSLERLSDFHGNRSKWQSKWQSIERQWE
jgi:hypothetical protein